MSVFQTADYDVMLQRTPVSEGLQSPMVKVRDLGSWSLGLCSETVGVRFSASRSTGLGLPMVLFPFARSL